MGTFLEELDDHEGYADRRLADGRLAGGMWSRETQDWTAYVAACGCGWHGTRDHPPTDVGEETALGEWVREHAHPLLAQRAKRRRGELTRVLDWLGAHADQLNDPAALARVSRAVDRARELVADVQRHLERHPSTREAGGESHQR
jgi:hypothetical protein